MITREPQIGEAIEYNPKAIQGEEDWTAAGIVESIDGNIIYLFNSTLDEGAHKRFFGKGPVPTGCERANAGFIWKFQDRLNQLHRIKNT